MLASAYQPYLYLSRPVSRRHPMDVGRRAKQFAPFAALRGLDETIRQQEILYEPKRDLSEEKKNELDIGQRVTADRAYIFEQNDRGTFDNTYEWCKAGVSKEKDNLQDVPYEGIIEAWFAQFQESNNVIIHDIEECKKTSEAIYERLKPQGVNTLVTRPIKINGKMVGFYGVDNPPEEKLHEISNLIDMIEFMISLCSMFCN